MPKEGLDRVLGGCLILAHGRPSGGRQEIEVALARALADATAAGRWRLSERRHLRVRTAMPTARRMAARSVRREERSKPS